MNHVESKQNHIELNNEVLKTNPETGFFSLEKDKEAALAFKNVAFSRTLHFPNEIERIQYMIENDYYYRDLLKQYTLEQIEELHRILYSYQFEFQSYMAISKFYKDYVLRTNDRKTYLENYEQHIAIVALYLAQGDYERAVRDAIQMILQKVQPATPTFMNAGRARRGEMISCFLIEMDDSLNSIGFNIDQSMQLSKIGGGVAINLSKLRARQEAIKGIDGAASGPIPVSKLLEDAFNYADQLGQRKGAGAAYLNIFHQDVIEFLDTKKIAADEKSRLQSLSIGLIAEKIFFDLAERNEDMYVFAPHTVHKAYGVHLDDMDLDAMYYELLGNPDVKKKKLDLTARELLTKIAQIQLESGYPYFMFKTNANEQHALKELGRVKMSNLCTEIFQIQEASVINDYGQEDEIKYDVNCTLASLNMVPVMEGKDMKTPVFAAMDMLTSVSDITELYNNPAIQKAKEEIHAVGLGAMNLNGYLAKNNIRFEAAETKDLVRTFFMMMNYYSLMRSAEIAKERGIVFKGFEKSEYANGNYFQKYLIEDFSPRTEQVKELFAGMPIPTIEDWYNLMLFVQTYGLYHAYRLAIAPTQSISYIQNSTSSVMPVVDVIERRKYANATTVYPMPYLTPETYYSYKSAYDMNQLNVIDVIAEIQPHVDQGISTILYVNSDVGTNELARYYIYAQKKGLKSLYYTRTRNLQVDECLACAV